MAINNKKKVIVIGAGIGGLTAALRLARMGFTVELFEKNIRPGGKMNERQLGDFRFDTGPSVLTMRFVFEELFQFLGKDIKNYLNLQPVAPICRYFFPDNIVFDAYQESDAMEDAIRSLAPQDIANYQRYRTYTKKLYQHTGELFLQSPIHELGQLLTIKNLPQFINVTRLDAFTTMHDRITRFFEDPHLIQIFDRYATYNGSDPYQAPATLNMISYVENDMGAYYITGGMYKLVERLIELCREFGINVHLGTRVDKIVSSKGTLRGVEVSGSEIAADFVVCNNDVVTSFQNLIPGYETKRQQLSRLEPSLSGLVFLWGINKTHEQLKHHNIFFSADYRTEFLHLFKHLTPGPDPTIYVAITSKADPQHAPAGAENWFVLLNMPYLTPQQNWNEYVPRLRQTVLDKLKGFGFDINSHIVEEEVLTPLMFHQLFGSNRGSIYGLSSNSRFAAFMRPANRNRQIDGLYFAGGSTHPGGGIPLVTLSGKIVSELIASKAGINRVTK